MCNGEGAQRARRKIRSTAERQRSDGGVTCGPRGYVTNSGRRGRVGEGSVARFSPVDDPPAVQLALDDFFWMDAVLEAVFAHEVMSQHPA
ncbi:hypothetical protein FGB62_201g019 [Gracilaria domingensis]|nr:hypothetical protein FGB62_201g019 [Gracilaria domingensis]